MWGKIGWSTWAIAPALMLAFHFGPGQKLLRNDQAVDRLNVAQQEDAEASRLQVIAYEAQFKTLEARKTLLAEESEANRLEVERAMQAEQSAYAAASDAWKNAADRYQEVESLLEGNPRAKQIKWLRGRALVRAGEVFNGIEALQETLDEATQEEHPDAKLVKATREELAACALLRCKASS